MRRQAVNGKLPCTKCGRSLPVAEFRLRPGKRMEHRHSWCLDCKRSLDRVRVAAKRARKRALP